MYSKFKQRLGIIGKKYYELLDLHLWVLSYFLMLKSRSEENSVESKIAQDIIDKYHTNKELKDYQKEAKELLEGV